MGYKIVVSIVLMVVIITSGTLTPILSSSSLWIRDTVKIPPMAWAESSLGSSLSTSGDSDIGYEPKILQKDPGLWYMNGYDTGIIDGAWSTPGKALTEAYYSNSSVLRNYLSMYFVNTNNNTIFLVLTNLSLSIQDDIVNLIKPSKDVVIKFLKGPAPLVKLQYWEKIILSKRESLKENGVIINRVALTTNGTILISMENMDEQKIEFLKKTLESEIPLGILCIQQMNKPIEIMSNRDSYRPIIGGITEQNPGGSTGTIGFYVTYNDGFKGFITAGHCTGYPTNPVMYQPTSSDLANRIGVTIARSPTSGYCWGDSALIRLDPSVSTAARIYNNTIIHNVTGSFSYYDMWVGQDIEMTGQTSGTLTGKIKYLGALGSYYDQLTATFHAQGGDSGSPVYDKTYDSQKGVYNCRAFAIVYAIDAPPPYTTETYCTPITSLMRDLGQYLWFDDKGWGDDFGGVVQGTTVWSKLSVNNNNLALVQGPPLRVLQLAITASGTGQAQTGYVTNKQIDINHKNVEMDGVTLNSLDNEILMISTTKVTSTDPYLEDNWYRCMKYKDVNGNYHFKIEKKVGGVYTSLQDFNALSPTGKIRINVDGGYIRFFENDVNRYSVVYNLLSYNVYVYLYTSTNKGAAGKLDYVDNFYYQSYMLNEPSNLAASSVSIDKVDLTWVDNSQNEVRFEIERRIGSTGSWFWIANVGPSVRSFHDLDVKPQTQYYYRVRAYDGAYYSAYSNEASTTIPTSSLYMVVRGGYDNIYYKSKPPSGNWGDWALVTGGSTIAAPATARQGNLLHIVVRGSDNGLWHKTINTVTWAQSGWSFVGGTALSAPALTSNGDRLSLVVRGTNNLVYYKNYRNGAWDQTWQTINGATSDSPAAALLGDKLHIAVRGENANTIWHIVLDSNGEIIHDWRQVGDISSGPTLTAQSGTGKVWLGRRLDNGALSYREYTESNDTWGNWVSLPESSPFAPSLAAIGDRLYFAVLGNDGSLWWGYCDPPGAFGGWNPMGGSALSPPGLD